MPRAPVCNLVVWPTFSRRLAKDPRAWDPSGKATPLLVVHIVLVAIALGLAAASAVLWVAVLIGG